MGITDLLWCLIQFKVDEIRGIIDQKLKDFKALMSHRDFWLKFVRLLIIT